MTADHSASEVAVAAHRMAPCQMASRPQPCARAPHAIPMHPWDRAGTPMRRRFFAMSATALALGLAALVASPLAAAAEDAVPIGAAAALPPETAAPAALPPAPQPPGPPQIPGDPALRALLYGADLSAVA